MKETVDTFQNLYQIRNVTEIILPDNHMDRFEKLRFNMVIIIIIIITTATIITTKKHKTGLIRIVVFFTLAGLQLSNELLSISFFFIFSFSFSFVLQSFQALLILNKEMETNSQIGVSCLPKYLESAQNLANRKCFVTSLEYVNGRYST